MEDGFIFAKLLVFIAYYARIVFYFLVMAVIVYFVVLIFLYVLAESIDDGSIFMIGAGVGAVYGWYRFNVYRDNDINVVNVYVGIFLFFAAMSAAHWIMVRLTEEDY